MNFQDEVSTCLRKLKRVHVACVGLLFATMDVIAARRLVQHHNLDNTEALDCLVASGSSSGAAISSSGAGAPKPSGAGQ